MDIGVMGVAAILFGIVIMCLVGYLIGDTRGHGSEGVLLGLLLGPIGWIITLLLPAAGAKSQPFPGGTRIVASAAPAAQGAEPLKLFVLMNDQTKGPFTLPHVRLMLSDKKITPETLCAREGDSQWLPVGDFL